MIFPEDLSVLHDDNGTFIDWSVEANDFGRDSFVLPLVAAEDHLYVGLYKPFKQLYLELKVLNVIANDLTAEYWDGSTWNNLSSFLDMTKGMTRSGFLSWDKPTDWAKTAVNGDEMYWVRFVPSVDITGTTEIQGLNIVFADDQDLVNEFSNVLSYLQSLSSFISYHQSVRDDIVQSLRNKGNVKTNSTANELKKITKWDLLDINEVKMGAVYGVLSKIFFQLSDDPEDKWYQRHKDYEAKCKEALELYSLSLDKNDDGIENKSEMVQYQGVSLFRQ